MGRLRVFLAASLLMLLVACGTTKVEPGYYRVKSGDNLSLIARQQNTTVGNLVQWNKLRNSDQIEVGQVLRVVPPGGQSNMGSGTSARTNAARPKPSAPAAAPAGPSPSSVAIAKKISLAWPAAGKVTRNFDGSKSNGLFIANSSGTPIVAASAGTVAYAASGLRGYGHLVIIKHGSEFLSIYAHNRKLLVKEGQNVKQGQKIAEMGDSDSKQVGLYFELRYNGRAVNPSAALPAR